MTAAVETEVAVQAPVRHASVKSVNFYGDNLPTVEFINPDGDREIGVIGQALAKSLGLDWTRQLQKLTSGDPRYTAFTVKIQTERQTREMAVIPLRFLNAYLFSINPMKIPDDKTVPLSDGTEVSVREKIIRYQAECTVVLHDYWMHGVALNLRPVPHDVTYPFRDARIASRPQLVEAIKRYAKFYKSCMNITIDPDYEGPSLEEELYQPMLDMIYQTNCVKLDHEEASLSGRDAAIIAFSELTVATIVNHLVAHDILEDNIIGFCETHLVEHLATIGDNFLVVGDTMPKGLAQ